MKDGFYWARPKNESAMWVVVRIQDDTVTFSGVCGNAPLDEGTGEVQGELLGGRLEWIDWTNKYGTEYTFTGPIPMPPRVEPNTYALSDDKVAMIDAALRHFGAGKELGNPLIDEILAVLEVKDVTTSS